MANPPSTARKGASAASADDRAKPDDPVLGGLVSERPAPGTVHELRGGLVSPQVPSRYRAHLLPDAKPTERGIVYRRGRDRFLLEWRRVLLAFAAEVGEPEGVRTIVFDLVIENDGSQCIACRLDADPGEDATALARAVELGVGRERCAASLRALAIEGIPTRGYPDLDTFAEATLEAVRYRA
jgi:hypothetical protein